MQKIAVGRVLFFLLALIVALVSSYFIGDSLRDAEKPSEYIGVTFSILAASLFAVVSIIGDPSMLLPGNWRVGWESAKNIQNKLQRLNLLFLWYVTTLGLLVFTEIVEHQKWACLYFFHYVFAFFSVFGFIVSLALPFELARIQRDRLGEEIQRRKTNASN
jgi:NADH:ubiquinone oxidoreductase subunit 5 (subunit L)/multisubunit Na+/H+ antiporter MnhA subunit